MFYINHLSFVWSCLTCFVESQQTGIIAMPKYEKVRIEKFEGHDFRFWRMQNRRLCLLKEITWATDLKETWSNEAGMRH